MRSFWDLVGFEYKKILQRKGALFTLIAITILTLSSPAFVLIGRVYVDGEPGESYYDAMKKDRAHTRALAGRVVDAVLLKEAQDSYANIPMVERYTLTPEYEQYGRPYHYIYHLMRRTLGVSNLQTLQNVSLEQMQNFYLLRHEQIVKNINQLHIREQSKETLREFSAKVQTPFVFSHITECKLGTNAKLLSSSP